MIRPTTTDVVIQRLPGGHTRFDVGGPVPDHELVPLFAALLDYLGPRRRVEAAAELLDLGPLPTVTSEDDHPNELVFIACEEGREGCRLGARIPAAERASWNATDVALLIEQREYEAQVALAAAHPRLAEEVATVVADSTRGVGTHALAQPYIDAICAGLAEAFPHLTTTGSATGAEANR